MYCNLLTLHTKLTKYSFKEATNSKFDKADRTEGEVCKNIHKIFKGGLQDKLDRDFPFFFIFHYGYAMGGDARTLVREEAGSCASTDLGHVGGPANLDVPATDHHTVHLLQSQLGSLGHLILHEGKPAGQGTITNTA